jgi:protein-S-isoprenylcysteine O-methyltransferase Ste14
VSLTRAYFALQLLAFGIGIAVKVSRQRQVLGHSPIVLGAAGQGGLVDWWDRLAPILLIFWPACWVWAAMGNTPVADGARGALGLLLSGVGTAFTVASIFLMGRAWRIGIDPSNRSELAEDGPYRWIRHPIYSGMLLVAVGNALLIPHPAVFAVAAASCLGFAFQARREEDHLRRTFGERYTRYLARTGRFAPRLRARG